MRRREDRRRSRGRDTKLAVAEQDAVIKDTAAAEGLEWRERKSPAEGDPFRRRWQ